MSSRNESWAILVGLLNNKSMRFQHKDSWPVGEYEQNFAWSDCEPFLAFVKTLNGGEQQITVLEFLGDSSYTINKEIRLKEEREVELLGWSTRRGGFEYMSGDREFLEIR